MTQQNTSQGVSLEQLQVACDECKQAIASQDEALARAAMERICDLCRQVKADIPELTSLRKHLHEMTEVFEGDTASIK